MSYNRNSLFISWNGDFISENILDSQYMAMMQLMHLPLFVTTFMEEQYKAVGIDFRFWEIGYEDIRNPDDGIPTMNTPKHDVLFLGNAYYPDRVELGNVLRSLKGINVGIYGNWKRIKANGMNIYDFADGMRLYRNCKIAVSDCRKARGYVSNRLFQELYAGAFVLQKRIEGMEELIGLQDGVHLVIWDTFDDLKEKIVYWLDRDEERKKIAEAGQLYVSVNHSFDVRVQELEVMMAQQKFVFHTKGILGL
jgi:glycosyltransferase involved in cell wall biosynthesis